MERIVIPKHMEPIVESYFRNGAKRLYKMVDKILYKLHFTNVDNQDFYSLANEIFIYAIRDYDSTKSFDGFLYSCLYKKFCSEMTSRLREKRCVTIKEKEKNEKGEIVEKTLVLNDVSLYTPVGDDENLTIGDSIADSSTIEKELFEEKEDGYSRKMMTYLERLSPLQKEVLKLNIAGYLPNEIKEELHINEKEYTNCVAAIHSYKNVSILF